MSNLSDKPWLVPGHMYQYDIGWLVDKLLSFETELNTAIDLKTIHYADPIKWDITTQYSPNTVVVDPKTGTAYMSKVPVPAGVLLTNTDYWVVIFNYQRIYDKIMSGIAFNDKDNLNASRDLLINDLVWYGGDLYRCTRAIPKGTTYLPGTNLTPTTIADCLATYYGRDRVAQVLNDTVNVSGDYTLNAGDIAETASNVTIHSTRDMLLDADGNLTEQVAGGKTSEVGGKLTERVTGSREIDVDGDDSVHVDGVSSINRGGAVTEVYGSSVDKRVTGAFTESFDDTVTSTYNGRRIVKGKDIEVTADSVSGDVGDVDLTTKSAIIHFPNKEVDLANLPKPNLSNMLYFSNAGTLTIQSDVGIVGQGFTMSDDRFYYGLRTTDEAKQYIYSINRVSGEYTFKTYNNLGHLNGMTYGNKVIYACTWKLKDNSDNGIAVINPNTLVINSFINTTVPINAIAYDSVNNKLYGRGSNSAFYEINPATGVLKKLFNKPAYPFNFTAQGMGYYDGHFYLPTTSPTGMIILDLQGNVTASYNIFPWAGLMRLKELEDIEIDSNGMLYCNSSWWVPGNKPVYAIPLQFAKFNLTKPEAVDLDYLEQFHNHATLTVDNTIFNFIRGSLEVPFYDVYEAFWACQAIAAYGGTPVTVNVKKTSKPYIAAEYRGFNMAVLNGNSADFYNLALYDGSAIINNVNVKNACTNNSVIVCTRFNGLINLVTADSGLAGILFNITDSKITLTGVQNSDYSKQVRAERSEVLCYNNLKFELPTSAPVNIVNGIYAGDVNIGTSDAKATLSRLTMKEGYKRFTKFVIAIENVAYTLYGSGSVKVSDTNTITLRVENDGLYLKATAAVKASIYLY